jgi:hypothetical protein
MHHPTLRPFTFTIRLSWVCLAALLLALVSSTALPAHAAGVTYVDSGASGANDGTSWADAYTSLQSALTAASSGDQIWVTAGSYTPTTGSDRSASFTLKNDVALYGGFAGTETLLSERSWTANVTTLSGDIGTAGNASDNSYHVVTGATGATLDGFTISGGNASPSGSGGGIYNAAASPTLSNLIISGNAAADGGGGIYNNASSPTLTDITISNNQAIYGGGMYNHDASNAVLTNVIVSGNNATGNGGGIFNQNNSSPTLTNVILSGNTANQGGGIFNNVSSPTLMNVMISGNTGNSGGGMYNTTMSSPMLTNVTFTGNSSTGGGGILNNGGSPTLTNVIISGNTANNYGAGIANWNNSSSTLTNVTISGNWSGLADGGAGIDNYNGSRIFIRNSIIWGNRINTSASSIYNNTNASATVSYSLVEGGYSGTGNLNSDPQFVSPVAATSDPTTTGDYRLQISSPAIDAGDNSVVAATTDLDGKPRQADLRSVTNTGSGTAPIVDMGAYEVPVVAISSITRLSPATTPTSATSVQIQVVFAESVSGVDTSDFDVLLISLSGNIGTTSITNVSGSGSTYAVTVDTSGGEGLLFFEPGSAAQVANASGTAAGVGAFTGDAIFIIDRSISTPLFTGITTNSGAQASGTTTDPTINLNGSADAWDSVTLSRATVGVIGTTTANGAGMWSFDYTGTSLPFGSSSFSASASDDAGNTSPVSNDFVVTVRATRVMYVRSSASGANDGSSWPNAYTSLQSALNAASAGDQIWVAAGSYTPGSDRSDSFRLVNGVAVYGGFAGTETQLGQRNWATNITALSGDIGTVGNTSDNSYHVVTGASGATLDGFSISGGNANGSGNDNGGGIYNAAASPTLSNLIISGNAAADGGAGIYNNASNPTLMNITISGNVANYGGGMYNNNASSAIVTNTTISGNSATNNGGGIYNTLSSPTLTNVLISGNTANLGGGIYNVSASSPTLTNVTIAGNRAVNQGGGIYNNGGDLQIRNSIIWGNRAGTSASALFIASGTPAVSYSLVDGGYSGTGNLSSDPHFVSPVDAASTPTTSGNYHLQLSSPAIDQGNNAALPTDQSDLDGDSNTTEPIPYDLDDRTRSMSTVDLGAYESNYCTFYASPYTVPAGDSVALVRAITCANDNPDANIINLTNSTYSFSAANNTDINFGGNALPIITTPITINGNGAALERASAAPEFRLLDIEGGTLSLDHITLTGGKGVLGGGIRNLGTVTLTHSSVISNSTDNDGGGIRNEGSLTISDSSIINNSAGGSGGGINNLNVVKITNSSIANNTAGAIGGGMSNQASITIINSSIVGNRVTGNGFGGGIANGNDLTVVNSIISGNSTPGRGGGLYIGDGTTTLVNSTLSGNSSGQGGAIYVQNSLPTITNSILWGNNSQIDGNAANITYSTVEGGYAGNGNRSSDPLFVSPVAPTAAPTTSGDYRLQAASPALNVGNTVALPADDDDLDGDANTAEAIPYDRDGNARVVSGTVDLGAYEHQPPNQLPALDPFANLTLLEDAAAQTINLSGINAGTGESQTLTIIAISSNPALIANPSVSYISPKANGSLSFTPAANANGTATITVTVRDSGGTNDGGVDTLVRSFIVTITPVNDAPSFTPGANQTLQAGAGTATVSGWASGFTPGPADEASQTLLEYTIVSNNAADLFSVAPVINAAGTLTYTPKPGAHGTATISVAARDSGGTANGGVDISAIHTFTITIGGSYLVYLPLVLGS